MTAARPVVMGCDEDSRPRDTFVRMSLDVPTRSRVKALLLLLVGMGYTKIRWQRDLGHVFTAFDEQRIASIIVIDVAPLDDGFPVPRLSPGRAEGMHNLCIAYLQDHVKTKKVRADYIALPDTRDIGDRLLLTQRRGVAWAFAKERAHDACQRPKASGHAPLP
ncbi:MAG: hypothetical protein IKG69_04425 [Atopobiaceae bacterium]|nr:hypothetical protein [Atopobiaceae bacterium]